MTESSSAGARQVCLSRTAASLLSEARHQEMPDDNILSEKYRDSGILAYFLVDDISSTYNCFYFFFLCFLAPMIKW